MLTPITLPLAVWVVPLVLYAVAIVLAGRARRGYLRAMSNYREAARRLDTVAAATDVVDVLGTVIHLPSARDRGAVRQDRPRHDLDYAEQTAQMRRDARNETY